MKKLTHALFMVQKIGPYHHARLDTWAKFTTASIAVIEFRTSDRVYRWDTIRQEGRYSRFETRSRDELYRTLDELQPQVIVCVGYFDKEIHQAMAWALRHRVPLVTCSDSTSYDEPRRWIKEAFKRRVVTAFNSGLAAGNRAHAYLKSLGLDDKRRFAPWDVVDNAYFDQGAELSRKNESALRRKLCLPSEYFLCVSRFVEKKNLFRLVEGYAEYVRRSDGETWSLVLSGSGPLEEELRARAVSAGLRGKVFFPGFIQYKDLPLFYGLAESFVLPSLSDQWGLVVNEAMASGLPVLVSTRCGCAPDLVKEGQNGFTFEPSNKEAIAECLLRMSRLTPLKRADMGKRSREIVRAFSPEAFAQGVEAATMYALADKGMRSPLVSRLLVSLLAMRKVRGNS